MQNKEIPEWAKCPITKELMLDPVIAADGRTYERAAIEQLIAQNPRGPVLAPGSSSPLKHSYLRVDTKRLRKIIAWVQTQPQGVQDKYEQGRSAQLKKPTLELVAIKGSGNSFFEQLPKDLLPQIIGRDLDVLTLSECKNLAQAGIPGVSEYFKIAIGAANQNVRKFLDHVRRGESAEADEMLKEDPALLTLKDVKIAKLFLHLLRGESDKAEEMRRADEALLPDKEFKISQFLVHVSTGNLVEVEKMLKSKDAKEGPDLLFKKGRLVDFGLRRFTEASKEGEAKGIYAWQYADATPDESMKGLLKRYCPAEREKELNKQLEESRNEKENKHYKALDELRHSIGTNRDALGIFLEFLKPLDTRQKYEMVADKLEELWRNVVEAQLKLATCVFHLMTEKGENVGWDASETGPREPKTRDPENIKWVYDRLGKMNDNFCLGVVRGERPRAVQWSGGGIVRVMELLVYGAIVAEVGGRRAARIDHQKLSQLLAPTRAAVPKDSSDDSPSARSIK